MIAALPVRSVVPGLCAAVLVCSTGAVRSLAGTGEPEPASAEPTIELYSGTGGTAESGYGYGGAVWSPLGLYGTGWRLKSVMGGGVYRYRGAVGLVDGHFGFGEVMAGYQWRLDPITIKAYGGLHIEDHDLQRPDLSNPVQGTRAGVKGQAELWADLERYGFVSVNAGLSSVFESYSAKARVGIWIWDDLALGPEAAALGNEEYDQGRVGAFARVRLGDFAAVFGAGWAQDFDGEGRPYLLLSLESKF